MLSIFWVLVISCFELWKFIKSCTMLCTLFCIFGVIDDNLYLWNCNSIKYHTHLIGKILKDEQCKIIASICKNRNIFSFQEHAQSISTTLERNLAVDNIWKCDKAHPNFAILLYWYALVKYRYLSIGMHEEIYTGMFTEAFCSIRYLEKGNTTHP